MIEIIKPHGAIAEHLVSKIKKGPDGRFAVIDVHGNHYGIEETTFNNLKERGIPEYEIK